MKRAVIFFLLAIIQWVLFGQSPNSFNYQAVLRDTNGNIKNNANVIIRIEIIQGNTAGTSVYSETHSTKTNAFGLINLEIGAKDSSMFSSIDWFRGPYFIKINVDSVEMGISQLLSVPYAKFADKAGNGFSGNYSDLINKPVNISSFKLDANNQRIVNVASPSNNKDVATKSYVDSVLEARIKSINTIAAGGSVKDAAGNIYNTVKIGSQVWMAENLRQGSSCNFYISDRIGDPYFNYDWIVYNPMLIDDEHHAILHSCCYNNDFSNTVTYGTLYNYTYVLNNNVCPVGWHIPSNAEWDTLITYLGGYSIAGNKLKETGSNHWANSNTADNSSGFSALPGGGLYEYFFQENDRWKTGVKFQDINIRASFWSSTKTTRGWFGYPENCFYRYDIYSTGVIKVTMARHDGLNIRCIKN